MTTEPTTGQPESAPTFTPKEMAALYTKITAVTAAVKRIPKNGRNEFHKYNYALESDITDGLRELLHEHHLAFLPPSVVSWERSEGPKRRDGSTGDDLTRVQYRFTLADCDTGASLTSLWWSEAQDNADKSFNKAATAAAKYWLMKTFLIATGSDPDEGPAQEQEKPPQRQQQPRQQAPRPPQAPPATNGHQAPPSRSEEQTVADIIASFGEATDLRALTGKGAQVPSTLSEQAKADIRKAFNDRRTALEGAPA